MQILAWIVTKQPSKQVRIKKQIDVDISVI